MRKDIYVGRDYMYEEMNTIVTISASNYADKDFKVINSNGKVNCFVPQLGIALTVNMKDLVEI